MTAPAASGTLYASVDDLKLVLDGTDEGTGTPAQLSAEQLTLALYRASNTVSVYAGGQYDGSSPEAQPPGILHDLALDLAVFWSWKTYLKGKEMPATHPAFIAYQNAMEMLERVRTGDILLDVVAEPGVSAAGTVINRVPQVFTGDDSNTRVGPDGILEADSPFWTPRAGGLLGGGPVYQG